MESTPIVLPTTPVAATVTKPKNLITYAKPKIGKTSALIQLDNALLIDLEDGSDYVSGLKIKAHNVADIRRIGDAIIAANRPYKYIIIDTITALEEMCIPLAEETYSHTAIGKSWFTKGKLEYGSIINLPNGAGYFWLRNAFDKVIGFIKQLAPYIVFVGHVKDIFLEKAGVEVNSLDLDLTGKLKRIMATDSDSIGYMYRRGNKNFISFITSDEISCGSRSNHLRNKDVLISELMEDGTLVTHWDEIYK